MDETCTCPSQAGSLVCDLPGSIIEVPISGPGACPTCRQVGKRVQGQTVKALLAVSLRSVVEDDYFFCRVEGCPVVYFAADGGQPYTTSDIRERIYQKEPERHDVFVCYCFRHTVGEIREAGSVATTSLLNDITDGIQVGQCACDLRNPQGSCCLGNVRALIKQHTEPVAARREQDREHA